MSADPAESRTSADHPTAARRTAARPVGSRLLAHVLVTLYALVVTPIATGLISYGGTAWTRYTFAYGSESALVEFLSTSRGLLATIALVLGLALVVSVVATGLASSAGLLAVGALGLVSIVLTVVPALTTRLYGILFEALPPGVLDAIVYGIPLVLHPLMGGLGLALVLARRRPGTPLPLSLAGIVLLPLGLLLGTGLLLGGLGYGAALAMRTFDLTVRPSVVVLVLAGALLVTLAAAASRWSPYALVLPGLLLIGASALALAHPAVLAPVLMTSLTGSTALTFLAVGGGFAVGLAMLAHTGVLTAVRHRARRRLRAATS